MEHSLFTGNWVEIYESTFIRKIFQNKFVVGITQKQKLTTQKREKKSFWENNENVIAAGAVRCNLLDMFCYVVTTFNADCKIPQSNKMLSKFVPRYPAAQSKLYVWFNVSPEIVKIHAEFQNICKTKSSILKTFHIYSMIWILKIVASQVLY